MMRFIRTIGGAILVLVGASVCAASVQPPTPPTQLTQPTQRPQPTQQDEFVPVDQLPPQDQLPAAPLLVAAYSFVVLALFLYMFSVARRLRGVTRDIERLESDLKRSGRT